MRATCVALFMTAFATGNAAAQTITPGELHILRIEGTPIGALPRMALPMPASRDHHYWAFRVQGGYRGGRGGGTDLPTIAGGVDLQWRGGSTVGITAGYQARDCELLGPDCGGHTLFGLRGRFGIMTGGSRIGERLGDYSATTTLGTELGFGYAPEVIPGSPACTIDFLVPLSLAMFQAVRMIAYATPGVVWDVDCGGEPAAQRATYLAAVGIGAQQLFHPGFDIYLGLQKFLRTGTGYQFGVSASFTLLP